MEDLIKPRNPLDEMKARLSQPTEERPLPVVEPEPVVETVATENEEVNDPGIANKSLTSEMLSSEVDLAIGFIDFTQENIFRTTVKYKRRKKLLNSFGEDALERAEILSDGSVSKDAMTEADKAILKVQKKVDEVIEGLPFSEQETKALRPLLEKYIINNNGKLPENFFAYLGMIQIFGGRLLNVLML